MAFATSFSFILIGAERFDRLRSDRRARAFLDGAGPAAIGCDPRLYDPTGARHVRGMAGVCAGRSGVRPSWVRRSVVLTLLGAGLVGTVTALAGGPLPS